MNSQCQLLSYSEREAISEEIENEKKKKCVEITNQYMNRMHNEIQSMKKRLGKKTNNKENKISSSTNFKFDTNDANHKVFVSNQVSSNPVGPHMKNE